ncbi:epidermal growth factor-like protein [Anastrepha ludens]|uniref:epidermal growth factor-like protein n=1 Tax=Anastrepha ludens TaxID=28586 RepID=UPI0023B1CA4B|nr:epidermal growth factor-like protein [Anastrepha ludens]
MLTMHSLVKIVFLLTVLATIATIEVSAFLQAWCRRYESNGKIIHFCCPGFKHNGINCTFRCHNDCVNGRCVGPLLCECNEGFAKLHGHNSPCEPIPDNFTSSTPPTCAERCSNGTCVEDLCICAQGWMLQKQEKVDICAPQCGEPSANGSIGCVNGFCSAPGICACYEGFVPLTDNEFECVRSADWGLWKQLTQEFWYLTLACIILLILILLRWG